MKGFANADVAAVFDSYPKKMRSKLLFLRELVFDTAAATPGVGELEETLKWGEPAYVTKESRIGTTIRIDRKKSEQDKYAMYFHCQTDLVETFRVIFPEAFAYEGNRAIVFHEDEKVPVRELSICIAAALTYHRTRKTKALPIITPAHSRATFQQRSKGHSRQVARAEAARKT